MARSNITNIKQEFNVDRGSAMISIVRGEQLEIPIVLDFVEIAASSGYIFEAVVIEAANTKPGEIPEEENPNGIETAVNVRIPSNMGQWVSGLAVNFGDFVSEGGRYYTPKRTTTAADTVSPSTDFNLWSELDPRTVYLQIPSTLSVNPLWEVLPKVNKPVYGFFELTGVQSAQYGVVGFSKLTKPVRGLIEIRFSPSMLRVPV